MAKKKTKKWVSFIKYGAILFGILGAIMTVLAFVNYGDVTFTGIQVIFGHAKTADLIVTQTSTQILAFSIFALLSIALPLVGSFSTLFKNKFIRLIGALMMITGAVLCFLIPNFIVFANELQQGIFEAIGGTIGIGAILAGAFFGVGSICNLIALIN